MKDMSLCKSSLRAATNLSMKHLLKSLAVCTAVGAAVNLNAQTVTFDPRTYSDAYTYMSWSPTAYTLATSGKRRLWCRWLVSGCFTGSHFRQPVDPQPKCQYL